MDCSGDCGESNAECVLVDRLTEPQILQLQLLYQNEWWTRGRVLEEVRVMLEHSDYVFGLVKPITDELVAFVRVLTDRVFKALVLDFIVHPKYRSAGLGKKLLRHVMEHEVISRVRHVELYCLSELVGFYEKHGFTGELSELRLMRRTL